MNHVHPKRLSARIFAGILLVSIFAALMVTVFAYFREKEMALRYAGQSESQNITWTSSVLEQAIAQSQELFYKLQSDSRLFELIKDYDATVTSPAAANRVFQTIVKSHLSNEDVICDVQLFRSDLVLYLNNVSMAGLNNYQKADFLSQANTPGTFFWQPTYDIITAYGHTQLEGLTLSNQYLISLVGMMNSYSLESSCLEYLPSDEEKPVLVVSIPESYLTSALPTSDYEGTQTFLTDENGYVISSTDASKRAAVLDSDMMQTILQVESGAGMDQTVQGEHLLVFTNQLSNGWHLVSLVKYQSVWKSIAMGLFLPLTVILLGLIALCTFISGSISHALSKPLSELINAIRQNEQGNFDTRVLETDDEFGALIENYNRMSKRITEMIEENYQSRSRERETEMMALRYQTNPHFLYNALNILYMKSLDENAPETAQLVQLLSHVMRYVIRDHRDVVTIADELKNGQAYFQLMNAGYDNKMRLEIDVDDALLNGQLPKLSIQPLLENAILHGISGYTQEGLIRVTGRVQDGMLTVAVEDNGAGLPENPQSSAKDHGSIGIANVQKRLQFLFGQESTLTLSPSDLGGAKAEMILPWRCEKNDTIQK